MPTYRVAIWDALIALLESPVPEHNTVGRSILARVLGPSPIDFGKPVFNFKENEHLSALPRPGAAPVVWESKLKPKLPPNARTVLNPMDKEGQELLLDFLGASWFISSFVSLFI
jgi:hypothetical protein